MENLVAILIIFGLPTILVWALALGDLMTRRDEEFPGRFDKLVWVVILFLTGLVGAIVYFVYRPRRPFSTDSDASAIDSRRREKRMDMIRKGQVQCPKCGAELNTVTDEGIRHPDEEPWRLICDSCGMELDTTDTG